MEELVFEPVDLAAEEDEVVEVLDKAVDTIQDYELETKKLRGAIREALSKLLPAYKEKGAYAEAWLKTACEVLADAIGYELPETGYEAPGEEGEGKAAVEKEDDVPMFLKFRSLIRQAKGLEVEDASDARYAGNKLDEIFGMAQEAEAKGLITSEQLRDLQKLATGR